jgi:hypothetical protein
MIQMATYITYIAYTTYIMGTTLAQIPDPQKDLTYAEVKNALNCFSSHPYHQHFLEIRAGTLDNQSRSGPFTGQN